MSLGAVEPPGCLSLASPVPGSRSRCRAHRQNVEERRGVGAPLACSRHDSHVAQDSGGAEELGTGLGTVPWLQIL